MGEVNQAMVEATAALFQAKAEDKAAAELLNAEIEKLPEFEAAKTTYEAVQAAMVFANEVAQQAGGEDGEWSIEDQEATLAAVEELLGDTEEVEEAKGRLAYHKEMSERMAKLLEGYDEQDLDDDEVAELQDDESEAPQDVSSN